MIFRVVLPFKAGQANANGDIYPENVIKSAIRRFNDRTKNEEVLGGITKRGDLTWKDPTHKILGSTVSDDGQIMFKCETLRSEEGRSLERTLTEQDIEYLPIMELPKDQPKIVDGIRTFTEITKIIGISIGIKEEKKDEHK